MTITDEKHYFTTVVILAQSSQMLKTVAKRL